MWTGARAAGARAGSQGRPSFSGKSKVETPKLLIVEDDADQRHLIREQLEDHFGKGTVVGVADMSSALKLDIASFNLILADYNLPDGIGMELVDEVRRRCNTPVILVTGENVAHTAAEAIRRGATDYVVKVGDYLFTIPLVVEKNLTVAKLMRENETLRQELETALRDVRDKNDQLRQSLRMVEELAATDPLTTLYNRRHFSRVLEQLFAEAQRFETDLSCVMIDLDGYKRLNDTHGHALGDRLLVIAGKVISANMRRMDVAARYGGDEFVLLLPHASAEMASQVAERIRDEFAMVSAGELKSAHPVTMSVGIASVNVNRPAGCDQLVALADAALYQAKKSGRNRTVAAATILDFTAEQPLGRLPLAGV